MDSYADDDDDAPDAPPSSYTPSDQALSAFRQIESGGNPNAQTGSYKGLYQLSDGEFRKYGGQGSIFDPNENHRIAKLKIADEGNQLAQMLGRPVTDSEVYLAHQQGVGGAYAHLSNPNQPAWQSMAGTGEGRQKGAGWARQAIWGNIPDQYKAQFGNVDNVTSGDFAKMWNARFSRAMGQPTQALAFAGNSDSNTSPAAAAINRAVKKPGALSMASTDDDEEDTPALSKANGTGALFKGEGPNKLVTLGSMLSNVAASLASITNPAQSRALREQAQGFDQMTAGNYQYQMGANGQLVRINKQTGDVDSVSIPGASEDKWLPHYNPDGTFAGSFNSRTNKFSGPSGGDAAAQPQIGGDPNLVGQERYDSLTPDEKKTIDAWEAGTGIQPTSMALRNPKIAKLVDAANAIGIDMQKYGARQSMARELTKSGPSAAGGQLDSSGAMIGHVTDLADDYIKLRDLGQSEGFGATAINAAKNAVAPAGSQRDQLLKSIATHSNNFAGEVTKQLAGAPGGQEERNRRVNLINQPNAAPSTQAASLEAELRDAIAKRQATLDRIKDTMGEGYMAKNPRFKKQEDQLEVAKQKLLELRNGPAIKDKPAKGSTPQAAPKLDEGWTYLGTK